MITGIEINKSFVRALEGPYRAFTGIVDHPGVAIVNDEARSYLSRPGTSFDVLQMSLKHKVHMRTAAYMVAVARVAEATLTRGIYP